MSLLRLVLGALLLALSACQAGGEPVRPALWEVTSPQGQRGWLFGTIHSLPEPVEWQSDAMKSALAGADRLVLEIDNAGDARAIDAIYRRLAASRGLPPLIERVPPDQRGAFDALMRKHRLNPRDFAQTETWAVALTLSRAVTAQSKGTFGMEQELMRATPGLPVIALAGAEAQLRIFDGLPETEQQDLLAAVIEEASGAISSERLARAWATGDLLALEKEMQTGILADPELREALMLAPNRDWAAQVVAMLTDGARPFVAVGAAHMAGPEGIPALLEARGFTVRRLQ
ncbi:MAG TPA: TraB/GumN family protein [Novosphingobium sp.]|nr:TraB/GumN family protein [Novosphingobium sp.]